MGYTPPEKIFKLVFEDPVLDGLEVRMREISLGRLLDLVEQAGTNPTTLTREDVPAVRLLYGTLADNIISWNMEIPAGTPIEPTREALLDRGPTFANAIVQAWMQALGGVDAPLAPGSPSTPLPDLPSIPMGALPASLVS